MVPTPSLYSLTSIEPGFLLDYMLGCDEGFQLAYEFESQPRVIAILAVVGPMTAFQRNARRVFE
jgi:hypothetical protein